MLVEIILGLYSLLSVPECVSRRVRSEVLVSPLSLMGLQFCGTLLFLTKTPLFSEGGCVMGIKWDEICRNLYLGCSGS